MSLTLTTLIESKVIKEELWDELIDSIMFYHSESGIARFMFHAIKNGDLNLITCLCSYGVDPFIGGEKYDPPIFGLIHSKNQEYDKLFSAIIKGISQFRLEKLAGIMETREPNIAKNLLQKAIYDDMDVWWVSVGNE